MSRQWTPAASTNVAKTMVAYAQRMGYSIPSGLLRLAESQLHVELPVNLVKGTK